MILKPLNVFSNYAYCVKISNFYFHFYYGKTSKEDRKNLKNSSQTAMKIPVVGRLIDPGSFGNISQRAKTDTNRSTDLIFFSIFDIFGDVHMQQRCGTSVPVSMCE